MVRLYLKSAGIEVAGTKVIQFPHRRQKPLSMSASEPTDRTSPFKLMPFYTNRYLRFCPVAHPDHRAFRVRWSNGRTRDD